jgi:hypothetical protein
MVSQSIIWIQTTRARARELMTNVALKTEMKIEVVDLMDWQRKKW